MRLAGEISLRASSLLVAILAALHLAAFLLPWFSGLDVFPALLVDACAGLSVLLAVRRLQSLRGLSLRLHDAGHAELVAADDARPVVLAPHSQVFAGSIAVLHWTDPGDGRRGSACLLRAATPPDAWRLLARWLRWRVERAPDQAQS